MTEQEKEFRAKFRQLKIEVEDIGMSLDEYLIIEDELLDIFEIIDKNPENFCEGTKRLGREVLRRARGLAEGAMGF